MAGNLALRVAVEHFTWRATLSGAPNAVLRNGHLFLGVAVARWWAVTETLRPRGYAQQFRAAGYDQTFR